MASIINWFERVGRARAANELRRLGYTKVAENLTSQEAE